MSKGAVVVTGAGRGIGFAIAKALAADGFDLALIDIDAETVETAVTKLDNGGTYMAHVCDISDFDSVQRVTDEIQEEFGGIYGLVNNAGITRDTLLVRMKPENWKLVLDINLTGTFNFTRAVAPLMMRQREGRIVSIASVIGMTGNAGQANYAASKAGVIALMKSVAKELGGRSVTANAIAPGFIATDMTDKLSDKVKDAMLGAIPLKRFGQVEDVAGMVSFLLSPAASYITGQVLVCDGGMTV